MQHLSSAVISSVTSLVRCPLAPQVWIQEPVSALAWAGDGILAAVPGGYKLIQSGRKVGRGPESFPWEAISNLHGAVNTASSSIMECGNSA